MGYAIPYVWMEPHLMRTTGRAEGPVPRSPTSRSNHDERTLNPKVGELLSTVGLSISTHIHLIRPPPPDDTCR